MIDTISTMEVSDLHELASKLKPESEVAENEGITDKLVPIFLQTLAKEAHEELCRRGFCKNLK